MIRRPGNRPARRLAPRAAALAGAGALAGGCGTVQSSFNAWGPDAAAIAEIGRTMFVGGALVAALVTALGVVAVFAPPERRRWLAGRRAILVGGVLFPAVVLTALLVYGFVVAARLSPDARPAVVIEVVGEQWWWRVHYLDVQGGVDFVTANEIRLPVGVPVELRLRAADVIHSFWVPNLAGKLDMIPGHDNRLRLRAERTGRLRGQCAEYCGGAHALMAFEVLVEPRGEFERWRERQRMPAEAPSDARLARGRALFLAQGCATCHAVRGTPAAGERGPDLTHVGGRLTLGAGILPNNVGTIAGWIGSNQDLKPGNLMPEYRVLGGEDLQALAAWLGSLR